MIYAMSDLHGCYELYCAMLEKIRFGNDDTLYVLGDCVDRGPEGIRIVRDLAARDNVQLLCGNHEYTAMTLLSAREDTEDGGFPQKLCDILAAWFCDGGVSTATEFLRLADDERSRVLAFLRALPFFQKIEVNGKQYLLAHTVPEKEKIDDAKPVDFVIGEPDYDSRYFDDVTIVTGHTPTALIDMASRGRIWRKNGHIALDCGAVFGEGLGCICLDTMQEFYVK